MVEIQTKYLDVVFTVGVVLIVADPVLARVGLEDPLLSCVAQGDVVTAGSDLVPLDPAPLLSSWGGIVHAGGKALKTGPCALSIRDESAVENGVGGLKVDGLVVVAETVKIVISNRRHLTGSWDHFTFWASFASRKS